MMPLTEFMTLVDTELGLTVDRDQLDLPMDQVVGWDSVLLLKLMTALEAATTVPQSLPALLHATSLRQLHQRVRDVQ